MNRNSQFLRNFLLLTILTTPLAHSLKLHYQLSGSPQNYQSADWVVVDLFDSNFQNIKKLKDAGKFVVCYFSAGSAENWRSDFKDFPKKVIGKKLAGWEGEYWLDIRSSEVMRIHKKRLDRAAQIGCNGVDPDNVDAYQNKTGFPLKESHQLSFLKKLVAEARSRSLSIGLKNATDLASKLSKDFDWIIIEECYKYKECPRYESFPKMGKPAFVIEYSKYNQKNCDDAKKRGFDLMFSDLALKGPFKYCK